MATEKKSRAEWLEDMKSSQNSGNYERAAKIREALQLEPVDYGALQAAETEGQLDAANEIRRQAGMQLISDEGAPMGVRAVAGASRGPGAVQQALEQQYPGQVQPFGQDNFLIPGQSGRPTPYNPPGLDWGDVAGFGRPMAEMGGALVGGALGAGAGGGPTLGLGAFPGMMMGAGLGGESAGQAYDAVMQNIFGAQDTRAPGQQLQDMALSATANSMGGPMGRGPAAMGPVMQRNAQAQMMDDAAAAVGLPPLTPAQRGNRFSERVEGALEGSLFGSPPIVQQREQISDAVGRYIDDTWPSPMSRQEAGASTITGVQESATGLRGRITELYDKIDELIDTDGRIDVPRSQQWLAEIDAAAKRDPEYAALLNRDPQLMRYMKVLRNATKDVPPTTRQVPAGEPRMGAAGQLVTPMRDEIVDPGHPPALPPYDTVKRFRTSVGSALDSPFTAAQPGTSMPEKRRLYATLSDDMEAGATQLGGPEAAQAASRAAWFNRGVMRRLEKLDPVFKNADNPTKVYEALSSRVMSNPSVVAAAKKTLPAGAWEDFVNRYVRDTLAATPGAETAAGDAVSFNTIATNLNRLKRRSPEGYALIAGDKEKALGHLHVISNKLRENARFFNTSRTGNVNSLGSLGMAGGSGGMGYLMSGSPMMALATAGMGLASTTALPWLTAKTLTSPTIQRAVEKVARGPMTGVSTPRQLAAALVAAGADEEELVELMQMQEGLGQ